MFPILKAFNSRKGQEKQKETKSIPDQTNLWSDSKLPFPVKDPLRYFCGNHKKRTTRVKVLKNELGGGKQREISVNFEIGALAILQSEQRVSFANGA
jgi:hypothetical protein